MDIEPKDKPEAIEEVKGDVVNFSGQAKQVTAQTVNVKDGAVGSVRGETVSAKVENGGIGAVLAQKADAQVTNGGIGAVLAREATVPGSTISMVAAMRVSGDAKIMFDLRAGLLAGIAAGMVVSVFKLITGRRK